MTRIATCVLCAVLAGATAMAGAAGPAAAAGLERPDGDTRTKIDDGVTRHERYRIYDGQPFAAVALTVDPEVAEVSLGLAEPRAGWSTETFHGKTGALAVATGGYLRSFTPPVPTGLLRHDGETLVDLAGDAKLLNGVLCLQPTAAGRPAATIRSLQRVDADRGILADYRHCRQAGPLLVRGGEPVVTTGKLDDLSNSSFGSGLYRRIGIGVAGDGSIAIVWTTKVAMKGLAALAARSPENGGFGLKKMLALPGRNMASLVYRNRAGDRRVQGNASIRLPDAFLVEAD